MVLCTPATPAGLLTTNFQAGGFFSSCFKFFRVSLETGANEMYQGLRLMSELPGSLQKVLQECEDGAWVWVLPTGEGVLPREGRLTDALVAWSFTTSKVFSEIFHPGFPGGPVVKNPPANSGDTGLIPGSARSHMPQSNEAHPLQLLVHSPRACAPH